MKTRAENALLSQWDFQFFSVISFSLNIISVSLTRALIKSEMLLSQF